jgi:hypothetical protein
MPYAEIYGLLHPETHELRYIGKANDSKKRWLSHMRENRRRTPLYDWIGSLPSPPLLLVMFRCNQGQDWREMERFAIADARAHGFRLLNLADGGDEPYCSPEVRAANGQEIAKLRTATPEKAKLYNAKRQLGQALKRGYMSEETKAVLRERARRDPKNWGVFAKA